ncbi:proline 3-hydroxylase, demethylmenaquinone methyltransferase [Pseudoloma neurophilia]|uniref:Proline 3-hydroxylase, demethylmenaquinone methyltransferase n=1 Tax=Pseudoloma neurophilia TaxID=146866 RepID=A0A0R0LZG4_9MICR|nr:proline 3-hydroxylase, demethylmenaquinone methyltransferase [Pseudoloma neurophilia]
MSYKKEEYVLENITNDFYKTNNVAFSNTRYKPWPAITDFTADLKESDVFLDLGCGNGRNLPKNGIKIAIEPCLKFLQEIKQKNETYPEKMNYKNIMLIQSTADCLSIKNSSIDKLLCCAVLHHLLDPSNCLKEIARVMKPEKTGLIVVWGEKGLKNKKIKEIVDYEPDMLECSELKKKIIKLQLKLNDETENFGVNFYSLLDRIGKLILEIIKIENEQHNLVPSKSLKYCRAIRIFKGHFLINWKQTGAMRYYRFYNETEIKQILDEHGLKIERMEYQDESINCYIRKPSNSRFII